MPMCAPICHDVRNGCHANCIMGVATKSTTVATPITGDHQDVKKFIGTQHLSSD